MKPYPARNLLIMLAVLLARVLTRCSDSNNDIASCNKKNKGVSLGIQPTRRDGEGRVIMALDALSLHGSVEMGLQELRKMSSDFGGIYHETAAAVVKAATVQDIVEVVSSCMRHHVGVAARGNGHSINGQAQAPNGVVLDMTSLKGIQVFETYADVSAGELWIDVLRTTLKLGLAPRSWTDYLPLSVGGTLSNAGVSGQAFKFGPQISNVLQLRIVTGRGEAITCSPGMNENIFYGALGGLGQMGIITEARIALQRAPHMVRWMRFVYARFEEFAGDQERAIAVGEGESPFDYVEGFVLTNNGDPMNGWPSVPFSRDSEFDLSLLPKSAGQVLYCLEVAFHYHTHANLLDLNKRIERLVAPLRFIRGLEFSIDLPYFDFLNRVEGAEMAARSIGTWHAPHPWLNIFVPKSRILDFDATVFKHILKNGVGGPILVYPMLRNKWDDRMSAQVPEEEIFYLVALLRFRHPYPAGPSIQSIQAENEMILDFCRKAGIDVKLYLPHYKSEAEWKRHFGKNWKQFLNRKAMYDPSSILAPGQRIFSHLSPSSSSF